MTTDGDDTAVRASIEDAGDAGARADAQVRAVLGRVMAQRRSAGTALDWVEIVARHVGADPDCADFETFADRHPAPLDMGLHSRHYRSSTLAAGPARSGWVEPGLVPFPWSAQGSNAD